MQNNNLSSLDGIALYRSKNLESHLIVDTNVLLLFLVGIYDPNYLKDCPLTKKMGKVYDEKHFNLVKKIIEHFLYKVIITPHILSEVNMLSRTGIKPKSLLNDYFLNLINELKKWKEDTVELKILLRKGSVIEFGFTDISLIEMAKENENNNWIILTDDFNLYRNFIEKVPIIYFSSVVANDIIYK